MDTSVDTTCSLKSQVIQKHGYNLFVTVKIEKKNCFHSSDFFSFNRERVLLGKGLKILNGWWVS